MILDLYNHWLRTEYEKICNDFDMFTESSLFWEYGSKKIAYLKWDAQPKKNVKRTKRTKISESEHSEEDMVEAKNKTKKRKVNKGSVEQKNNGREGESSSEEYDKEKT